MLTKLRRRWLAALVIAAAIIGLTIAHLANPPDPCLLSFEGEEYCRQMTPPP